MYQDTIHCIDGQSNQNNLIQLANSLNINTAICGDYSVVVSSDDQNNFNNFINQISNNTNYCIINDNINFKTNFSMNDKPQITDLITESMKPQFNANTAVPNKTANNMAIYYNMPVQTPSPTAPKVTIGIISLGGGYRLSDLQYYWRYNCGYSYYPTVTNVLVGVSAVPTFNINDGASLENTLDLELAGGICPNSKLIFYSGVNSTAGFYNTIAAAINDTVNKPTIISISWGAPESEFAQNTATSYNQLFASAVSKGITICIASGDGGSTDGVSGRTVHVDFPSSSPYVVACGGTSISSTGVETCWSYNKTYNWGTGGGESIYFPKPTYQNGVSNISSNTFRSLPDISLLSDPLDGWIIYAGGANYSIGGTSCSAPSFSGYLSLLNLTFPKVNNVTVQLNTLLYRIALNNSLYSTCYKDMIGGNNDPNANVDNPVKYLCTTGFDMCTGWGSINGINLKNALINAL